jgi:ubiquinone/menaquinone biosynthesis C-methylase UbiE
MYELRSAFELYAREYDAWYEKNVIIYECERNAIDALKLKGIGLDIGVGSGRLSPVSERNYDTPLIGIDISKQMLLISKKRSIEPLQADAYELPFKNESFDYVFISVTFCFLEKPSIMLKEVYRILKPNGMIGICIVPRDSSWGNFYEEKGKQGHRFYKYAKFYTVEEVVEMLTVQRFKVLEYSSTLSYGPMDKPKLEKPSNKIKNMGFVCIKAVKM